jgi:hypothetical protein
MSVQDFNNKEAVTFLNTADTGLWLGSIKVLSKAVEITEVQVKMYFDGAINQSTQLSLGLYSQENETSLVGTSETIRATQLDKQENYLAFLRFDFTGLNIHPGTTPHFFRLNSTGHNDENVGVFRFWIDNPYTVTGGATNWNEYPYWYKVIGREA